MRYRLLGRTGLYVSELCLGTMTFGDQGWWKVLGGLGQEVATGLVKQAFDAGVNFIDTANVYSFGESEKLFTRITEREDLHYEAQVYARSMCAATRTQDGLSGSIQNYES